MFESGSGVVLGANFMRDKDVIFDMEQVCITSHDPHQKASAPSVSA